MTRYSPAMAPSLATTFGFEFEMVLAFHENDLERIMMQNNIHAEIKKDLSKAEHVALLGRLGRRKHQAASQRSHFPSWALLTNEDDPVLVLDAYELPRSGLLRSYLMEPLLIAQGALQQSGCQTEVMGPAMLYPNHNQGSATRKSSEGVQNMFHGKLDYSKWTLVNDFSLTGATKAQLLAACPGRITTKNVGSWDSFGIELVSRFFQVAEKEENIAEMSRYLAALKGPTASEDADQDLDTHCSTLKSIFAGTHVHVGFNIDSVEKLREVFPVFQHLAYILISHDDLLTQLHPPHRSGEFTQQWKDIATQTAQLDGESEDQQASRTVQASEKAWNGWQEVCSNARRMAEKLGDDGKPYWADFRTAIFDAEERVDVDILAFAQKMQEYDFRTSRLRRGYQVNWSNIVEHVAFLKGRSKKPSKPTIEFRQYACSLDAVEIQHWVDLLFAIVRAAEAKAIQTTKVQSAEPVDGDTGYADRECSKYRKNRVWQPSDLDDFLGPELLNLPDREIAYWRERYSEYGGRDSLRVFPHVEHGFRENSKDGDNEEGSSVLADDGVQLGEPGRSDKAEAFAERSNLESDMDGLDIC